MQNWLETFGHPLDDGSGKFGITTARESLVVSILSAGTFLGALTAVSRCLVLLLSLDSLLNYAARLSFLLSGRLR